MAKVKIQGHASGTGVLTVTAPNTSTDRTITLPDGTGTLIADDGSGNLGINTTTPSTNLEIKADDNLTTTFPVKVINSAGTGSTQFGAYAIDTTSVDLTLKAGGNTALTIDKNNGNVGFGVIPESDWGSRNVLQFGLGASISGRTGSVDLEVSRNAKYTGNNPTSTGKYINADQACMYRQNGEHSFHVAPSGTADAAITWTEAMNINNAGIVTKPTQPAFLVNKNADQALTSSAEVTVTWEDEVFDVGSNFASSTFTAPVTGKYFLQAQTRIDSFDTAAVYYRLGIETSNYNKLIIFDPNFASDLNYYSMQIASVFEMDAGDTAEVKFLQNSGTFSHIDDTGAYTNFCGYLLG